jgi:hypothetical protein
MQVSLLFSCSFWILLFILRLFFAPYYLFSISEKSSRSNIAEPRQSLYTTGLSIKAQTNPGQNNAVS